MSDNSQSNAPIPDNNAAHFVPLSVIMSEHKGQLADYCVHHQARNTVVTMPIEVDVAGKSRQSFYVAVAVTMDFETAEPLIDEAERQCPKKHQCLFAWIPAHLFGSDKFGIMIDEIGFGETLQNGLVNEVIDKAGIEAAVTKMNKAGIEAAVTKIDKA
jgi:hypothetical protein